MRSLGFNNIDHRIRQIDFTGDSLDPIFPNFDIKPQQIENMKSILIIGSDLRKETPLIAHWVKKAADQGASVNFINQEYSEYYFPIDNFILSGKEALAENLALVLKASNDDAVNKLPSHIEDVLNALPTPSLLLGIYFVLLSYDGILLPIPFSTFLFNLGVKTLSRGSKPIFLSHLLCCSRLANCFLVIFFGLRLRVFVVVTHAGSKCIVILAFGIMHLFLPLV